MAVCGINNTIVKNFSTKCMLLVRVVCEKNSQFGCAVMGCCGFSLPRSTHKGTRLGMLHRNSAQHPQRNVTLQHYEEIADGPVSGNILGLSLS